MIADEKSVIRKIKKDKDVNGIAMVVSSWHYLNALATMEFLLQSGRIKKGIILARSHQQAGFIVDEKLWNADIDDRIERAVFHYRFLPGWKEVKGYLNERIANEKDFYILQPVEPRVSFAAELWRSGLKRNYVHIVIDEGLGGYLRTAKGWMNERKVIDPLASVSRKDIFRKWQHQCYINVMLKKRGQLLYNTFFMKKGKYLSVNLSCKKYLSNIFENASSLYDYADYCKYENKLVICTQPFHDLGQVDNNADIEIIEQICKEAKRANIGVIIKPHPRETDMEKYSIIAGAEVDANNLIPLEIIVAGLKRKPKAIIGITTTTLVTAGILWGINTISIVDIIKKENFHDEVMEDIDNFPRLFSQYVKVPKKMDDLIKLLIM